MGSSIEELGLGTQSSREEDTWSLDAIDEKKKKKIVHCIFSCSLVLSRSFVRSRISQLLLENL